MQIKQVSVNKLNPAAYNPRKELEEGDPQFEALKENLLKFGFVQPIVVNKQTGNMVGGHQRLRVAKALNMAKVPVTEVDISLEEEKKLNLALNKVSGEWHEEKLGQLLAELKTTGDDLTLTGFGELEIEELTLAFSQIDLDAEFEAFAGGGGEYIPEEFENEYEAPEVAEVPEEQSRGTETKAVIKYEIIFDNELQQATWHEFMKKLKSEMDLNTHPTHASRIHEFLIKEVL